MPTDSVPDYERRIWLAHAPPGVWSSGPAVIYDFPGSSVSNERTLERYRGKNYRITGPYVLEDECPPSPS